MQGTIYDMATAQWNYNIAAHGNIDWASPGGEFW